MNEKRVVSDYSFNDIDTQVILNVLDILETCPCDYGHKLECKAYDYYKPISCQECWGKFLKGLKEKEEKKRNKTE